MASKDRWLLAAGLILLFSEGFAFITGLFTNPINPIQMVAGPEVTGWLLFGIFWVIIWASGALNWVKRKSPV